MGSKGKERGKGNIGCVWKYGRVEGFELYQEHQLHYPFATPSKSYHPDQQQLKIDTAPTNAEKGKWRSVGTNTTTSSHRDDSGLGNKRTSSVVGTVLQWPGEADIFVQAVQICNKIEGTFF